MKVTFIEPPKENRKPPIERVFGCTYTLYPFPNIFNLYVAGILKENGIEVSYKDAAAENITKNRFLKFIEKDDSDIYYIHSVNLSLNSDIKLSQEMLNLRKDSSIIFAGPGPTYFPEKYIYDKRIYAIRGEAEITAVELVKVLEKKEKNFKNILGMSYLDEEKMVHNPTRPLLKDLDSLSFPARNLVRRDLYYNPKLPGGYFTPLLASRNCPYNCIFCVPNSQSFAVELEYKRFYGRKPPMRARNAEGIIEEMQRIKEEGYKFVSIIDDQFLWDEQRTVKICEGIKELGIKWGCLSRCDKISEKIAKIMHDAGCTYVDLGVESFSQSALDYIKKNLKTKDIYDAVRYLKKYNIKPKINMLLGSTPFETEEDFCYNIEECLKLNPEAVMFSIASPFPGTEFYDLAKKNNWLNEYEYKPVSVQHDSVLNLPNINQERLQRLIKKANIRFYLRPNFVIRNAFRITHPKNLFYTLKAFYRKFFI